MQSTSTPIRLWCYAYEYCADVLSLCANGRYDLHGRTPYEAVLNYTPDISEYVSYGWFQWCWFYDEKFKIKQLCRWLGPAYGIGQYFCCHILVDSAKVITRSSVIAIPKDHLDSDEIKYQCMKFMDQVNSRIGNFKTPNYDNSHPEHIYFNTFGDEPDADDVVEPYEGEIEEQKLAEIDDAYIESLDNFLGAQVVIPGQNFPSILGIVK